MHISIDEHNALYEPFNKKRIEEGYTTFKSGIIAAMKMFIMSDTTISDNPSAHIKTFLDGDSSQ